MIKQSSYSIQPFNKQTEFVLTIGYLGYTKGKEGVKSRIDEEGGSKVQLWISIPISKSLAKFSKLMSTIQFMHSHGKQELQSKFEGFSVKRETSHHHNTFSWSSLEFFLRAIIL